MNKLAVNIPFIYREQRLQYLQKVLEGLETIDADVQVFIYTNNRHLSNQPFLNDRHLRIKHFFYCYKENARYKFHFRQWPGVLGLKWMVHPTFFTWEH